MTTPAIELVSDVVRRSAAAWPGRIAVQDAEGSVRLTYAELWREAERGAAVLRSMGLGAGDRVLLAVDPSPAWMVSFLAIAHAGLVVVPIPSTTPATLVRLVAMHARIRVGIANRASGWIGPALTGLKFITPAGLAGSDREAGRGRPDAAASRDANAVAVLVFTSGSTARPRAVALTHAALRANLRSLEALRHAGPGETVLSTLPPCHAYELVAGQLAPLAAGARIVYAGAPLPNRLVETIRTQAVTRMMLVPALLETLAREVIDGLASHGDVADACRLESAARLANRIRLLGSAERDRLRAAVRSRLGSAFRNVTVGGAAANAAWADVLGLAGIDLDIGYGLTEAGPVVAMGSASDSPAGSVGRPLPGVDVRIGQGGEILVRSAALMKGYAGDAPATAETFDGDWLRTGDTGRIDAAGFLFVTGRLKEAMVTPAGETIYPDEIEPFYASPVFAEFAVVPLPAADGNDHPTLIVVPSNEHAGDEEIRRSVASLRAAAPARLRVSGFIRRVEPLPRTAVGKIRRKVLAGEVQGHEVRT